MSTLINILGRYLGARPSLKQHCKIVFSPVWIKKLNKPSNNWISQNNWSTWNDLPVWPDSGNFQNIYLLTDRFVTKAYLHWQLIAFAFTSNVFYFLFFTGCINDAILCTSLKGIVWKIEHRFQYTPFEAIQFYKFWK